MVEYGLMLAFIVLVAVGILSATGTSIANLIGNITSQLQSAMAGTGNPVPSSR